jgi:hypothetical protein
LETRAKSEKWTYNEDWLVFWTTIGLDDPFHDVRTIRNLLLHKETEEISATEFAESPHHEQNNSTPASLYSWLKLRLSWKTDR